MLQFVYLLIKHCVWQHTSVSEPSQCLNAVMFAYFVNGTVGFDQCCLLYVDWLTIIGRQLPEDNSTVCEVDTDFEIFPGVNTEAILAAMVPRKIK